MAVLFCPLSCGSVNCNTYLIIPIGARSILGASFCSKHFMKKTSMVVGIFVSVIYAPESLAKETIMEPLKTFIYKENIEVSWIGEVELDGMSSVLDCMQKCGDNIPPRDGLMLINMDKCAYYIGDTWLRL